MINSIRTLGASNLSESQRHPEDYYATDPKAVEELLKVETFAPNIWECACGGGHISNVLIKHGYNVCSTDLYYRGYGRGGIDFLLQDKPFDGDIITNPPYKYAKEFITRALQLVPVGNKIAMLLRLQFLEGKARQKLFRAYPPKTVYVFSSRIHCAKNGNFEKYMSSAVAYAWFVWVKGYTGDPAIKWIG